MTEKTKTAVAAEGKLERNLVRPEGAKWITCIHFPDRDALVVNEQEVAVAKGNGCGPRFLVDRYWTNADSVPHAKRRVEEYLADNDLYGFRWEEVEPEPTEWLVMWRHSGNPRMARWWAGDDARRDFASLKNLGHKPRLYGLTKDGDFHLFDSCEEG